MKSVCSLLLFVNLLASSLAIKCFCDEPFCTGLSGEEEDCPERLDEDYYVKNPDFLQNLDQYVSQLFNLRDKIRRKVKCEAKRTPADKSKLEAEAKTFLTNSKRPDKVKFFESFNAIAKIIKAVEFAGEGPGEKILVMMDQAFAGTYNWIPRVFPYCLTIDSPDGVKARSCGIARQWETGETKLGCHEIQDERLNISLNYCRCDSDSCNIGDRSLAINLSLILTCLLLVLTMKLS